MPSIFRETKTSPPSPCKSEQLPTISHWNTCAVIRKWIPTHSPLFLAVHLANFVLTLNACFDVTFQWKWLESCWPAAKLKICFGCTWRMWNIQDSGLRRNSPQTSQQPISAFNLTNCNREQVKLNCGCAAEHTAYYVYVMLCVAALLTLVSA